jgi:hypothetical protein
MKTRQISGKLAVLFLASMVLFGTGCRKGGAATGSPTENRPIPSEGQRGEQILALRDTVNGDIQLGDDKGRVVALIGPPSSDQATKSGNSGGRVLTYYAGRCAIDSEMTCRRLVQFVFDKDGRLQAIASTVPGIRTRVAATR